MPVQRISPKEQWNLEIPVSQGKGYASEVAAGNVLRSSGVSKALWYIKKENETWKVMFIREHL